MRDRAFELVEDGFITYEQLASMAVKYMSTDDVEDMLDCNELSARFHEDADEDEEPDVDYHQELFDAFGEDC